MDIRKSLESQVQVKPGMDPQTLHKLLASLNEDLNSAFTHSESSRKANALFTSKRKREASTPPSFPLLLGSMSVECYSLARTHSLYEGLPLTFYVAKPTTARKGKLKPDVSIRLGTGRHSDCAAIGKVPAALSRFLHPLASAGAIALRGALGRVPDSVDVIEPLQTVIEVHLLGTDFSDAGALSTHFESLFAALNLRKTKSPACTQFESLSAAMVFEETNDREAEPHPSFTGKLYAHQKRALAWMLGREGECNLRSPDSLWAEYCTTAGEPIRFDPNSGEIATAEKPRGTGNGGILADEMGLGKTVMVCALLASHPRPPSSAHKRAPVALGQTLLVVPVSLLQHWTTELSSLVPHLSIYEYHGARNSSQLTSAAVVLTTYSTLASEYTHSSEVFRVHWNRVVLDEGHHIRTRTALAAQACFSLKATYRWVLTGTPVVHSAEDLYSLVRFLGIQPWSDYTHWAERIATPIRKQEKAALGLLHSVLHPVILRRTKSKELADIVPPLRSTTRIVHLNDRERETYQGLWTGSRTVFRAMETYGVVKHSYSTIFEMLLRLRQACDHPYLVMGRSEASSTQKIESKVASILEDSSTSFAEELSSQLRSGADLDCPVCLSASEDAVLPPCGHLMCRLCAYHQVEVNGNCPLCKRALRVVDLKTAPRTQTFSIGKGAQWHSSSKVDAVLSEVQTCSGQTVVFSQWSAMLDLLGRALKQADISFARFDGDLSKEERAAALRQFSSGSRALLISMKAGGGGLDLTKAQKVVLVEPWCSIAMEQQAIERLHRIGQTQPVEAVRLVAKDTVEERLLQLRATHSTAFDRPATDASALSLDLIRSLFDSAQAV